MLTHWIRGGGTPSLLIQMLALHLYLLLTYCLLCLASSFNMRPVQIKITPMIAKAEDAITASPPSDAPPRHTARRNIGYKLISAPRIMANIPAFMLSWSPAMLPFQLTRRSGDPRSRSDKGVSCIDWFCPTWAGSFIRNWSIELLLHGVP